MIQNDTPLLMSISQQYLLAEKARRKLIHCARAYRDSEVNLRILVGHANLLDRLARDAALSASVGAKNLEEETRDVSDSDSDPSSESSESDGDDSGDEDSEDEWDGGYDSMSDSDSESDSESDLESDWDAQLGVIRYESASGPYCLYKPVSRLITTSTVVVTEEEREEEDDEEGQPIASAARRQCYDASPRLLVA